MDCIYCELGRASGTICDMREYFPYEEIASEIEEVVRAGHPRFDCLTFTASGEPTLHLRLGDLIEFSKSLIQRPVVVLTNSGLVSRHEVRQALASADIVLASLDAATPGAFRRINRPHECVVLEEVIEGLSALRSQMEGELWLEILFVSGVNDQDGEVAALANAVEQIDPHRVQLNTVVRPPAEEWARPVPQSRLEEIREALGARAEIIVDYRAKMKAGAAGLVEAEILDMLKRRPLTCREIKELFGFDADIDGILQRLERQGLIVTRRVDSKDFYCTANQAG
jgi:wyosine [tRNA(Phe)-imidazoG37] synthetase (radical SAM superfamily)